MISQSVAAAAASLAARLPAQAAAPGGPDFSVFLMFGSLFAIFYFLVLRPQQKQRRALEDAVKTASKGDAVITAGGLHGKIVSADDEAFTIEIASVKGQSVRVQVSRAKVESVTSKGAKAAEESDAGSKGADKDKKPVAADGKRGGGS